MKLRAIELLKAQKDAIQNKIYNLERMKEQLD